MTPTKRALIFSPSLAGHREVYGRVVASVLHDAGYSVVLAGAMHGRGGPGGYSQLAELASREGFHFHDTAGYAAEGRLIDAAAMARLIRSQGADLTVFLEADDHLRLLASQVRGRDRVLPGRRVGLFLRSTNYVHQPLDTPIRRWADLARGGTKAIASDPQLFHEVLLPRFRLLDAALCLDEVFVARRPSAHQWLPDICDDGAADALGDAEEADRCRAVLGEFLARNPGRPVYVYFGILQERRGYDKLMRVADEEDGIFVYGGEVLSSRVDAMGVTSLRESLLRRGRLLETGYVASFAAAQAILACAPCVVLPYVRHHGSSGVMLQALKAGRPVIVPDIGLMAERVRAHGLGRTYRYGDTEDLKRQYRELAMTPPAAFAKAIARFLVYFGADRVTQALRHAIGGDVGPVSLPSMTTPAQPA